MKTTKRIWGIIITLCMIVCLVPTAAFAAEKANPPKDLTFTDSGTNSMTASWYYPESVTDVPIYQFRAELFYQGQSVETRIFTRNSEIDTFADGKHDISFSNLEADELTDYGIRVSARQATEYAGDITYGNNPNAFDDYDPYIATKWTKWSEPAEDGSFDRGTAEPQPIPYNLYVSGKQVTSENAKDVLGDGGTVSYDAGSNTLTLNNASITKAYVKSKTSYGIYSNRCDLTIKLIGENKIQRSEGKLDIGIETNYGNLLILGDGSLNISPTEIYGIEVYNGYWGIIGAAITSATKHYYVSGLTMVDAALTTPGIEASLNGGAMYMKNSSLTSGAECVRIGNLIMENSTIVGDNYLNTSDIVATDSQITAVGAKEDCYDGIYAGSITATNSTITGTATGNVTRGDLCGIFVEYGDIIANNSTITGKVTGSFNGTSGFIGGIYAKNIAVNGGTVTGEVTGANGGIGIYSDYTLTVNGGTVKGIAGAEAENAYGIYIVEEAAINGGSVTGNSSGANGKGINAGGLIVQPGAKVSGSGQNASVEVYTVGDVKAEELIQLPDGYLPEGYELQRVTTTENSRTYTYAVIVPKGTALEYDVETGLFTGAATGEIILFAPFIKIQNAEKGTKSVTVTAEWETENTAPTVCAAVYDKIGVLVAMKPIENAQSAGSQTIEIPVSEALSAQTLTVKVYLWDDLNSMTPLALGNEKEI